MTTIALASSFPLVDALVAAYREAGGTIVDVVATVAATVATVIIDCDVTPALPGWAKKMTKNVPGGKVDANTVGWFQTEAMKNGSYTAGTDLGPAAKAAEWHTVNATFGQRIFENRALLSGVPKEIQVLICTDSEFLAHRGYSCFVCLYRVGGRWRLGPYWVGYEFDGKCAVLVSAKVPGPLN